MPHPLMYEEDNFVVLETNQPEQFLTAAELLEKLVNTIQTIPFDDLPQDIKKFSSVTEQAKYLIDTGCELDIEPGKYLQWYAVRLEK